MTTAITTYQDKPIESWNDIEIAAAKRLMNCPGATDAQWEKLVVLSRTYGLNPLLNEIWITQQGVFVGLDGLKKAAIRTGDLDGIKPSVHNKDGSQWIGDDDTLPAYATCIVWKKGCNHEFEQTVTWRDFGKGKEKYTTWKAMPGYMLEKVAKSHALKMAFNLEGLYIPEEFGEADPHDEAYDGIQIKNNKVLAEMPADDYFSKESKNNKNKDIPMYTEEQAKTMMTVFQEAGITDMGIFTMASLPGGFYDKNMLDNYWKEHRK